MLIRNELSSLREHLAHRWALTREAKERDYAPETAINEMMGGKTIADVRCFNTTGQEMQDAKGMTIVVTTYTHGTTSSVKVMKQSIPSCMWFFVGASGEIVKKVLPLHVIQYNTE